MDSINENSSDAGQHSKAVLHNVNLMFNMITSHIRVAPMGQSFKYGPQNNDVEVSDQAKKWSLVFCVIIYMPHYKIITMEITTTNVTIILVTVVLY